MRYVPHFYDKTRLDKWKYQEASKNSNKRMTKNKVPGCSVSCKEYGTARDGWAAGEREFRGFITAPA